MNRELGACLVLLLCVGAAAADLLPMGHKSIKQQYVLTNLDDYPDYDFVYNQKFEGKQSIAAGQPFSIPSISLAYEKELLAIPRQHALVPQKPTIKLKNPPFMRANHLPIGNPAVRSVVAFKVELADGKMRLTKLGEKRYDAKDQEVWFGASGFFGVLRSVAWPLAAIAAAILLVIVMVKILRSPAVP